MTNIDGDDEGDEPADQEAWEAEWDAAQAAARERLHEGVDLDAATGPPAGTVPAAAGARELAGRGDWPMDWVAQAAGDLPTGDVELLLTLLEAVVAPTNPTGLGDDEALLLMLEPEDWVDVALALAERGAGTPAGPGELAGFVAAPDELLTAAFELVVPVWQACGVVDVEFRVTRLGEWLVPRAVDAALRP